MKKNNILLISLLSTLILAGCGGNSPSPTPTSEPGPKEEDDTTVIIDRKDKEVIESAIVESELQTIYFINDKVLLDNVYLSYHDQSLRVGEGTIILPNGQKVTTSEYTIATLGDYSISFELELYAEILVANFTFKVIDYDESYSTLDPIDQSQLSIYWNKQYTPNKTELGDLFGREVVCNYAYALSPTNLTITDSEFLLSELGNYKLVYKFTSCGRDYYCTRVLLSKEKYTNKTGVFASAIGTKSSITITPNEPCGIKATLYKGEYIQFNEIIDLTNARFSGCYILNAPCFLDAQICFKKMTIKLVDLENSENYVLIDLMNLGDLNRTFVRAYAYNQTPEVYGNSCVCSMFGNPEECQANIIYDNKNKTFACGSTNNLCGDLDSSSYGENKWKGFSGNECLMSVYADEWQGNIDKADIGFDWVNDSREYKVTNL